MATSTLPLVKAALIGLLRANATITTPTPASPSGVLVAYGWPEPAPREHIFVGGTTEDTQEWAVIGGQQRSETYGLELVVVASQPGATQQAMTERAFVLFGAVETVCRTTPTLGLGAQVKALILQIKPRSLTEGVWDDGRIAVIEAEVHVQARI